MVFFFYSWTFLFFFRINVSKCEKHSTPKTNESGPIFFYTLSINKYDHKKKMQIELQNKTDWIWNELRDFESYFIKVLLWILSAHTVWCSFLLGNCSPEIVMLRSANAKHITTSFGSIFAVYQSAYHPRLKPALAHHTQLITKATENRKKKPTLHDFIHSHKQATLRLHSLLSENSKRWQ